MNVHCGLSMKAASLKKKIINKNLSNSNFDFAVYRIFTID